MPHLFLSIFLSVFWVFLVFSFTFFYFSSLSLLWVCLWFVFLYVFVVVSAFVCLFTYIWGVVVCLFVHSCAFCNMNLFFCIFKCMCLIITFVCFWRIDHICFSNNLPELVCCRYKRIQFIVGTIEILQRINSLSFINNLFSIRIIKPKFLWASRI